MQLTALRERIIQQLSVIYDMDESAALTKELMVFYADNTSRIEEAVIRLLQHEPLQYVLGEAWFYNLRFYVNEHVLIPRPETEELVHLILNDQHLLRSHVSILDIGTGSGCIPVSLKKNMPDADLFATDISADALAIAKENASRNGTDICFFQADILNTVSLPHLSVSMFDMIVSNPPYITEAEKEEMHDNVLQHEPHLALFVTDHNPLQFYEVISRFAAGHLTPGGKLYFEINASYGKEVKACMEKEGFSEVNITRDMQGKDRIVSGTFAG